VLKVDDLRDDGGRGRATTQTGADAPSPDRTRPHVDYHGAHAAFAATPNERTSP
jgi:hypothetical protein